MEIDVNLSVTCRDESIDFHPSLTNLGQEEVGVRDFNLVFPDGNALELNRQDAPQPDLSDFAADLLSGKPVWIRARVRYVAGRSRPGFVIKDYCVRRDATGKIGTVACKLRDEEAMGMLAYESQHFATAVQHFDAAFSEYEAEKCSFAIEELMQTHAYVLLITGRAEEAGFQLRSALALGDGSKMTKTRMGLLGNLANIQLTQNQAHAALATFEQALEAATEWNDRSSIGFAEAGIGSSHKLQGNRAEAEKWLRRAVATARADGDRLRLSRRLLTLGTLLEDMGRHEGAVVSLAESLSIAMEIGDYQNVEERCMYLWDACEANDDSTPFVRTGERLLEVLPENVAVETRIHVLNSLAAVYKKQSQLALAIERLEEAIAIACRTGDNASQMVILSNIGDCYARSGQYDRAADALRESMKMASVAGVWALVNVAKESLAKVLSESEDDAAVDAADSEYTELLTDWWFSQSPSDRDPRGELVLLEHPHHFEAFDWSSRPSPSTGTEHRSA